MKIIKLIKDYSYRILSIKPSGGLFFLGPFKGGGGGLLESYGAYWREGAYLFLEKIIS